MTGLEAWRRLRPPVSTRQLRVAIESLQAAERRPLALYALWTIALFLIFFAVTFPHDLVLRGLLDRETAALPARVEASGVRLSPTLAYAIDDLRLFERGGDASVPLFAASAVRVAPRRLGLLFGRPYPLALGGELYGGALTALIDPGPQAFRVRAELKELDAARYVGFERFLEGHVTGRLDGLIDLTGNAREIGTTNGPIELRLTDLTLEGVKIRGIAVPNLRFATVRAVGHVKNGRLELQDVGATGPELVLAAEGNVLLHVPLAASLMNLTLTVTPTAEAPEGLRLALNLLPGEVGAAGERRVRLFGTLAQPHLGR